MIGVKISLTGDSERNFVRAFVRTIDRFSRCDVSGGEIFSGFAELLAWRETGVRLTDWRETCPAGAATGRADARVVLAGPTGSYEQAGLAHCRTPPPSPGRVRLPAAGDQGRRETVCAERPFTRRR